MASNGKEDNQNQSLFDRIEIPTIPVQVRRQITQLEYETKQAEVEQREWPSPSSRFFPSLSFFSLFLFFYFPSFLCDVAVVFAP
jgi:hypothetical protein